MDVNEMAMRLCELEHRVKRLEAAARTTMGNYNAAESARRALSAVHSDL